MRTCFDVVFLYENIRTCLFTYVLLYFLHLVLTFTPPLHHNGKGSINIRTVILLLGSALIIGS